MPGPNQFQVRRTSVADREANTLTLPNAGELALNILDGRAFSTNGAVVFEIGANTKNCRVSNSFFVGNATVNVFANSTTIKVIDATTNTTITTTGITVDSGASASANRIVTGGRVAPGSLVLNSNDLALSGAQGVVLANTTSVIWSSTAAWSGTADTWLFRNAAGVLATNGSFMVGTSTVNVVANSTQLTLANSTVNTHLAVPTSGQYSATNYFLHANGSWVQVTGGTGSVRVYQSYTATADQTTFTVSGGYTIGQIEVFENGVHLANTEYTQDGSTVVLSVGALSGAIIEVAGWINMSSFSPVASGSNTWVQFNDSTAIGGSDGFTFDKATNTAVIGNTLAVGTAWTANSTLVNANAINCRNQVNTATLFVSTTVDVGANVDLSTTQLLVGNSTANMVANSITITIANSTGYSQINPSYMYNGNGATQALQSGGVGFWYGNNTTNVTSGTVTATTPYLQVANSTGSANLIPAGLVVGTSVVNSTVIVSGGSLLSANIQVNSQTTNYTLVAGDSGKVVSVSNTSAVTITIPAGLPIGFRCQVLRANTSTVTMSNTGQTGASIFSRTAAFAVTTQWGSASIFEPSANVYVIDGNI